MEASVKKTVLTELSDVKCDAWNEEVEARIGWKYSGKFVLRLGGYNGRIKT